MDGSTRAESDSSAELCSTRSVDTRQVTPTVFRRENRTRSMVERHDPSGECPRCETGQGSHSAKCRFCSDKVRAHETGLRRAEIPPTTTTTTATATTSATTSVPATTVSSQTLDPQTPATDVPPCTASTQSGGIKRPIEADSKMEVGVDGGDTDLPMLVSDQQPTVGGRRVLLNGSCLDNERPPPCSLPFTRTWVGRSTKRSRWRTPKPQCSLSLTAWCTRAGLASRFLPRRCWADRKAEMEEMANHHVAQFVAARRHGGREKWKRECAV